MCSEPERRGPLRRKVAAEVAMFRDLSACNGIKRRILSVRLTVKLYAPESEMCSVSELRFCEIIEWE